MPLGFSSLNKIGALGSAGAATAAPAIQSALQEMGVGKNTAAFAGAFAASAIGYGASGGSLAGATAGFTQDLNNRQLHPKEISSIRAIAPHFVKFLQDNGYGSYSEADAIKILAQNAADMVDSHQQTVANGNSTGVDAQAKQFLQGVAKEMTSQGVSLDGRDLFSASNADFYNHDKYMNLYNSQELVQFAYNNLGAMNLGSTPTPAAITQYMKYESDSNKRAMTAIGLLMGGGAVGLSVKAGSILAQMGVTAWRTCMANPVLCANEAAIAAGEVVGAEALPLGLGGAAGAAAVAKKLEQELAEVAVAVKTVNQFEKKFKHAGDFGVITTKKNSETIKQFEQAVQNHLSDASTIEKGTYLPSANSVVHFNPNTNNVVILDSNNNFVSGWRLIPGSTQYINYVTKGILR